MWSNTSERSSFRAHPRSRSRAREARNHARLYRTIYVLFRATLCGPMRTPGVDTIPPRRIARSRHGEANVVQYFREIFGSRAPEVSQPRARSAKPRTLV